MAESAAFLVDEVFPRVPVRQWVLSVPWSVRFELARDARLLSKALRIFVEEIFRDLRRRSGVRGARCGAVTAVQRFGGALNANVHFHSLVMDGIFVGEGPEGRPAFRPLPEPADEDLERVLERVRRRLARLPGLSGCLTSVPEDPVSTEGPEVLDVLKAASIRGWTGMSDPPRPVPVVGRREGEEVRWEPKPLCVAGEGFSLNAAVRISKTDREGLEQVCRYVLRPPFAEERLTRLEDGRLLYEFRRARRDGASHLILEPLELLEKLAALVPPPRFHLVRYHGVLAPHARSRSEVVPAGPVMAGEEACRRRRRRRGGEEAREPDRPRRRRRRKRLDWASLLKRTFGIDVLVCPRCAGPMAVISAITEEAVARKVLRAMGEADEAPRAAPARSPPAGEAFLFDQV